jgi:uncharacterized protein (DUF885 family)
MSGFSQRAIRSGALALLACGVAAGCAQVPPQPIAAAPSGQSERLAALFARSDAEALKRNPLQALDARRLQQCRAAAEIVRRRYYAAERTAAKRELAELERIERRTLRPSERISYDVFKWQRELDLRGLQPDLLASPRRGRSTIFTASTPASPG